MIRKILIAEDIDSINEGLGKHLRETFDLEIVQAKYCDEAYLKIKRALLDGTPFDLLLTDLSFKEDHREAKLLNGEMLVAKLRGENITIKTIMYSIEDRPYRVKNLVNTLKLDAFITKGRNSISEISTAIQAMIDGQDITSKMPASLNSEDDVSDLDDYDIMLLSKLADGLSQEEIGNLFRSQGIKPASLSSIEKRINKLKISLKAKNTIHLIAIAKDMGMI